MAVALINAQTATGKRILNFTVNTDKLGENTLTLDVVQTRLSLLEKYWSEILLRNIELQVHETSNADEDYFANDKFTDYETAYTLAKSKLRSRIAKFVEQAQAANEPNPLLRDAPIQVHSTASALPKLKLPTFTGKQEEWDTFKEVFSSMVKDSTVLTPVLKLQHLISCLEGEAARRLSNFEVIGSNFDVAWNALCRRYDNKRLRQAVQMFKLLNMAPVTQRVPSEYTRLLDTTGQCLRAFEQLRRPTDKWDDWFVHVIVYKLDQQTREDWEKSLEGTEDYPTYEKLSTFLENRVRSLDNARCNDTGKSEPKPKVTPKDKPRSVTAHHAQAGTSTTGTAFFAPPPQEKKKKDPCAGCHGAHFIAQCPMYLNCAVTQRKGAVKKMQLCENCLSAHHPTSSCNSKYRCRICREEHHSTLHDTPSGEFLPAGPRPQLAPVSGQVPTGTQAYISRLGGSVLLGTARVILQSPTGLCQEARMLIDPGSEGNFLNERITQLMQLKKFASNTNVNGVGGVTATSTSHVTAAVKSRTNSKVVLSFSALVLPKLTSLLPSSRVERHNWPHLEDLELADPDFHLPAEIDGILGADIYALIIQEGLLPGSPGTPVAQSTKFGWILTGATKPPTGVDSSSVNAYSITLKSTPSIAEELRRFWEIEEIASSPPLTPDEQACEDHFLKTHSRDKSGRYVLRLPFKKYPGSNDNKRTAVSLMQQMERRLAKDDALRTQYLKFMSEYENLGHLEMIPLDEIDSTPRRYLSHHGIMQNKLRVVFNGSIGEPTLNECLHIGAKLQRHINTVIIRWRLFEFVFTADIVKMYRQIRIHPDDTDWLRIVMRTSPDLALVEQRLLTVTYGTSCAPFQALRTLMQLAEDEGQDLPLGATVLRDHMYVDDAHAGADTLEEARHVKEQLIAILKRAGMSLDKWAANEQSLLPTSKNSPSEHLLDPEDTVSTLGLKWAPHSDVFSFNVRDAPIHDVITKRIVLSEIARLHDLFGLLAPVTVRAKMLLQLLWLAGNDWDSPISHSLQANWHEYRKQLTDLRSLKIPRWCGTSRNSDWSLFGFSDASERAYAAAAYLVCRSADGRLQSHLLASKTRVAPTKSLSIPRLELCGAFILAKLLAQLLEDLPDNVRTTHCFSDSEVVLAWLRKPPSAWQTFVGNRVSKIVTLLPDVTWHHVRSVENPADLATRGMTSAELCNSQLWWHGPTHLFEEPPPDNPEYETTIELKKEINAFSASVGTSGIEEILRRFSNLNRLLRVISYNRRFHFNSKLSPAARPPNILTALEIELTKQSLLLAVQREQFSDELSRLTNGRSLPRGNRLRPLLPFIDAHGMLRVGGRLQYSHLSYDEKHPIILPANSHLTELIIRQAHQTTLHGGPQLMLSYIVRRYWIIGVKPRLKSLYRKCVRCIRFQARPDNQQMAPVPAVRITPGPSFETTGVDYAGPFPVRTSKGRGHKSSKGYIAIFICMVTRATHIEVVSDYSSKTFLLAYERFTSRRGTPRLLYSDNGTTFHGADTELKGMFAEASNFSQSVAEAIADDGTTWTFIPPRGPHFGGLWEAAVKSFKFHLKRVLGNATLTFEEFSTLACRIESCLNSRPLSPLSSDPANISSLTPGHFLIGRALRSPPSTPATDDPIVGVERWRMLQAMREHFWRRWRKEVLHQFQVRSRWLIERSSPKVGDVVLLTDDQQPALHWPLARVEQLHPGADGLTRVVTLKTATTSFRRPLNRVILLPRDDAAIRHYEDTIVVRKPQQPGSAPSNTPADESPTRRPSTSTAAGLPVTAGGIQAVPQGPPGPPTSSTSAPSTAGGAASTAATERYNLRSRKRQSTSALSHTQD